MAFDVGTAIAAIGAGIAIAGGAIGTGVAQSGIGSAGLGLIAEKRENFGTVLLFFFIPETLLIFGFIIAILIMLKASLI
ncbi:MAG: ATPase [Candidatus Micrarchaeota archaeon]|nr:ATPase [Candidatus Micrarchaeota archaeon]MDE1834503.1 ATPase [Candidatus Micrarchaeota archaeon]MDE1859309.1 ATPase [Candidatus Micrarchaeota archaeon]